MSRLMPFVGGCLGALLVASAIAEQPGAGMPAHTGRDAACVHCHTNPHITKEHEPGRFQECVSCHVTEHFRPSTFGVEQHSALDFPLSGRHEAVACGQCHVGQKLIGLPMECAGCHVDRHRGLLGEACTDCHAVTGFTPVEGFVHEQTGFARVGKHAEAACEACHQGPNGQKLRQGAGPACGTCHESTHADFGRACSDCHAVDKGDFASARGLFDHRTTGFPLERRHAVQACGSCHAKGAPKPDTRCASCHTGPHDGQLGTQCQDCHAPDRWTLTRFDHDVSGFPLRGAHFTTPCASCHTNQRWIGLTTECWDCHALDAARAPTNVDAHRFGRSDCRDCHTTWKWTF